MEKETLIKIAAGGGAVVVAGLIGLNMLNNRTEPQQVSQIQNTPQFTAPSKEEKVLEETDIEDETTENEEGVTEITLELEEPGEDGEENGTPAVGEEGFKVTEHQGEIINATNKFHDFTNATAEHKQQVIDELARYGVTIDESMTGPWGLYDSPDNKPDHQSIVLAGTVVETDIIDEGNLIHINYKVRTGISPLFNSASFTGDSIQKALKDSSFSGETKDVYYTLVVAEDNQSAVLTQKTGQWW